MTGREQLTATAIGAVHAARLGFWIGVVVAAHGAGVRAGRLEALASGRADRAEADLERVTCTAETSG